LVYRSADGHGKLEIPRLRLRWDYTLFGLQDTSPLDISVQAIEMVYVPAGPFYVGSGGDETGSLTDGAWGGGAALPLRITSEAALELKQEAGYLWARALIQAGTLSNAYPKGYAAFYCMKYELTQGQYTKYLNQLTAAQAAQRFPGYTGTDRQTIGGSWPQYTNAAPERVANFVNWPDLAAYLAWAGLRPMTELEFEKACRGIKQPLANEYPWGDTTYINQTGYIGTDGSGTETADPIDANSGALGPVRAGIFARPDSDRILSGASYWGIMQLGGNVNERVVSLGQAGWSFSGSQGAGFLGATGLALNEDWPANDTAAGSGFRGGSWSGYANQQRTSHREHATTANITRHKAYSGRGVRTAPPDF
ncbi:MAG: SUMF1/EgtB/PvdO family nonheme iron enzyme, partial [Lentisphaerae bacterium]|nr:SUMF1/EgtB/PvdO family nonheme iron enzyme [Lentisphaerota bacterium]